MTRKLIFPQSVNWVRGFEIIEFWLELFSDTCICMSILRGAVVVFVLFSLGMIRV